MAALCQPITWGVVLSIMGFLCFTIVATVVVVLKTVRDLSMMRMFHEHVMAGLRPRQPNTLQLPPPEGCHAPKNYKGVI